jgi:Na+-transporting methylmalonyl-CoA/oxaloacetate decarboxylase gamma subunit
MKKPGRIILLILFPFILISAVASISKALRSENKPAPSANDFHENNKPKNTTIILTSGR